MMLMGVMCNNISQPWNAVVTVRLPGNQLRLQEVIILLTVVRAS